MGHFHLSQLATLTFQIWRKYGAGGNLHFPYSQLATLNISNMAPQGNFSLLTFGNSGTFSLLTVGNTDIFLLGAGGEGVT